MKNNSNIKYRFIIILIIGTLVLSGCSINTEIKIEDDLSINEKYNIVFNNNLAANYFTTKEYVNNYIDYYKSAIDFKKYNYEFKENNDGTSSVLFNKATSDFCTGINSNLFSNYLYDNILCTLENGDYIIESNGDNKMNLPASEKKFDVDEINLTITLPVLSNENNADTVSNNTYTWRFDKYTPNSKSIYLKINKKELDDKVEKIKNRKEKKEKLQKFIVYGILFSIIIVLIIFGFSIYKKYKQNKLEY